MEHEWEVRILYLFVDGFVVAAVVFVLNVAYTAATVIMNVCFFFL